MNLIEFIKSLKFEDVSQRHNERDINRLLKFKQKTSFIGNTCETDSIEFYINGTFGFIQIIESINYDGDPSDFSVLRTYPTHNFNLTEPLDNILMASNDISLLDFLRKRYKHILRDNIIESLV